MKGKTASALALAALIPAPASAQAPNDDYRNGRENWLAMRYPSAYPPLFDWRRAPYGRTAEVDYMLGTSACRIAGKREWGARALNFVLYSYALTSESRARVTRERDKCRQPGELAAVTAQDRTALQRLVPAGATARGKLFSFGSAIAAYPAHQVRTIEQAEFTRRLVPVGQPQKIAAALRPLLPEGAQVKVINRYAFVVAAGQSDAQLDAIAAILDNYVGFLDSEYGIEAPPHYLTLYLMPDIAAVQRVADKVHGLDVSPSTLGYAFQDDLSTVAMIRGTRAGTLLHELFHLLVRASFGDIPQWLDEGLASLYEVSTFDNGRQVGLPNWRGRVLDLAGEDGRPTLAAVVASPWFAFDMTGHAESPGYMMPPERMATNLATARYFALYLQDTRQLKQVYAAFRNRDPGAVEDPAAGAVALVTQVTGPLDTLQRVYDHWLPEMLRRDDSNAPATVGKTLPDS